MSWLFFWTCNHHAKVVGTSSYKIGMPLWPDLKLHPNLMDLLISHNFRQEALSWPSSITYTIKYVFSFHVFSPCYNTNSWSCISYQNLCSMQQQCKWWEHWIDSLNSKPIDFVVSVSFDCHFKRIHFEMHTYSLDTNWVLEMSPEKNPDKSLGLMMEGCAPKIQYSFLAFGTCTTLC